MKNNIKNNNQKNIKRCSVDEGSRLLYVVVSLNDNKLITICKIAGYSLEHVVMLW